MERRNLVIVRAGDSSLHPGWLQGLSTKERSWDLIVSYFGEDRQKYRGDGCERVDSKGPKWPALYELIRNKVDLIDRYDAVWLPDDDLECRGADINRMFEIFHNEGLQLAQPSLTQDSYFSYPATLHSPLFRIRYTSFVEIMAPCFSREALRRLLHTFNLNLSGWGLDFLWPTLLPEATSKMAILDAIQVRHTRPLGAANYGALRSIGRSAWDEMRELLEAHGLKKIIYIYGGVRSSGSSLKTQHGILFCYGLGLLTAAPTIKCGWKKFARLWLKAMRDQAHPSLTTARPDEDPS
jgi:uncharacterized protein DUF707